MTPISPRSFAEMFPWRKYLKEDKKREDEMFLTEKDFISEITDKILKKFIAYKKETGFYFENESVKKSFSDKIKTV